jgi:hypothetical protein
MMTSLIIILSIVILSLPLVSKSERMLRESYWEDDFAKQHDLVDTARLYKKLFAIIMSICLIALFTLFII